MPICGTQVCICDLPVRYDTYAGCTHDCKYCFVQRKTDISKVEMGESLTSLEKFIAGGRDATTRWCDWDIPIHFGGMSDPFQPAEDKYRRTLAALELFAKSKYPVIISTKGKLCIEEPWLSKLKEMNVVMQISAACSTYDKMEAGASTFEERIRMIEVLSQSVPRVIVRCQPYLHECYKDIKANIKRFADAGAYGVIFEAMKFVKKKKGLVRVGGDYTYPTHVLENDFKALRDECHKYGLKFYAGENRLRTMGDSLTCCGIDGLEGFKGNRFNGNHILNGEKVEATPAMKVKGYTQCFKALHQNTTSQNVILSNSFQDMMLYEIKNKNTRTALGKE